MGDIIDIIVQIVMSVFAFLDILGFKDYVKRDQSAAANMLLDLSTLLQNSTSSLSNFQEFFSGSDSLFITATDINSLSKGIAELLCDGFSLYSASHQHPSNPASPTDVELIDIAIENGHVVQHTISTFWPPLLFRGGISSLPTRTLKVINIENNCTIWQRNIIGNGVIDAVGVESVKFSGPRIFLSDRFNRSLLNSGTSDYIEPSFDHPTMLELYWPMHNVHTMNSLNNVLINEFRQMMDIAVNLWASVNHLSFGHHYYSLLKLIVQSFKRALVPAHGDASVKTSLIQHLKKNYPAISLKIADLVN